MVMGREDNVKLARDGGAIRGKKKKKNHSYAARTARMKNQKGKIQNETSPPPIMP